jgi:Ca2+-transporting ATPase
MIPTKAWEQMSVESIERELSTSCTRGLVLEEVRERRKRYGLNIFERKRDWGFVGVFLRQFRSPLVFILLAAGVGTFLLQEFVDTVVIFAALLINVGAGAFQEERASQAFDKLNKSKEHTAVVIRGGRKTVIPAEKLVVGDIVEVEAGSYIPADIRLVQTKDLSVNESALTGEWVGVVKEHVVLDKEAPLTEKRNMAWMGTLVGSGFGRGIVVATGNDTQLGSIASELGAINESVTPLQHGIRRVAHFLIYIIAASIALILILGFLRGEPFAEMLLIAIALAVATMPEGLPAAVTIVLALGMESILKRGGLVRNLLAAETLGATTIILTDKTGTLTEARMHVSSLYTYDSLNLEGRDEWTKDDRSLLEMAMLASDAFVEEGTVGEKTSTQRLKVHGRPIERAIVLAGLDAGISQHELMQQYPRIDFLPFQSSRRFGVALNAHSENTRRLYMTGAPETLLEHATHVLRNGKAEVLTADMRVHFEEVQKDRSADGLRFIGVGYKDVAKAHSKEQRISKLPEATLEGLVFAGFISFEDPIRKDVPSAIKEVQGAGAVVLMVTGDNPQTARKIACDVGISCDENEVRTGVDIEKMSDGELKDALRRYKIFARTLPEQKLRLVRILKSMGEVVAMTGDGINDAPALRSANIGVAVGSGTEVAKEASDMVLINNSFSIIVAAIREGRKIIDNLKKIIAYLLSTSFSEILVIGAALVAGTPLPLLPSQILWANIIQEGLMSFPLAFEKADKDLMKRRPQSLTTRSIITSSLRQLIFIVSGITGTFLIALYFFLYSMELPIDEIRTIMFVALSIGAMLFIFSLKSLDTPIWKINPFNNAFLLGALGISTLILVATVTVEPLRFLLSLTPITLNQALLLCGVGLFNLFTIEMVKFMTFKNQYA